MVYLGFSKPVKVFAMYDPGPGVFSECLDPLVRIPVPKPNLGEAF